LNSPDKSKLFYGHYIVGACFITLFFCWGMVLNTFPVFVKPITEDMNWERGDLAIAQLTGMIVSIILFPIAGKIIDRTGARAVMTVGALLMGLSLLAGSQITQLWHIYVMNGFIGGGLTCSTLVPCSFVISNWFVSRRGAAMAIAFVGTAAGGMVMSPIATWIIVNYSWRAAFALAGIEILVLVIPITVFVIRTRPSDKGLEPYGAVEAGSEDEEDVWGVSEKEAFALPVFWFIAVIVLIGAVVTAGVGFNCVAYLEEWHSQERASFAWAIVMGAMIVGKLTIGAIADYWGSKNTTIAVSVLFAVSLVILLFPESYTIAIVFAVVYGFTLGGPLILNPLLTGDYLGMKHYGTIFGILNIMGTLGGGIGSIGAASYFDKYRTYLPVFYIFIGLMIVAAICSVCIRPIKQAEDDGQTQPAN
jgi:sugar phosphate permease